MELNIKQKAFVEAYLRNGGNATQAAIEAGYASANADVTGPRLLGHVGIRKAIQERSRPILEAEMSLTDRILLERKRLAFYNPMRLAGIQTIEQLNALDEDTQRAIQGVKLLPDGTLEIKAADKDKSLAALEKISGLYKDKDDGAGVLNITIFTEPKE